jgi:hypothetical protein
MRMYGYELHNVFIFRALNLKISQLMGKHIIFGNITSLIFISVLQYANLYGYVFPCV